MPAHATLALAGIAAELADLFPAVPVYTAKRPVAGSRPPLGGWNPAWALPAFVISATDPEEVDAGGDFENVTVSYTVLVEFAKASAAKTKDGKDPQMQEDPEFRDTREAIRRRVYKPRVGALPDPTGVKCRSRPVYEASGAGASPVTVSGTAFTFETTEPRAE